jgi:hypothetical protein
LHDEFRDPAHEVSMPRTSTTAPRLTLPDRAKRAAFGLSLLFASGCYSYMPASLENIEPGQAVRVRLTPEEADRLQSVRQTDSRVMDGVVVNRSAGELLVETPVGRLDPMGGTRVLVQRIDIPLGEIRDIERRQRDRFKTGVAIGGVALVVGVGVVAALQGGSGRRTGEDPGPDESRSPVMIRVPVGF